jgi:hypothetical protein
MKLISVEHMIVRVNTTIKTVNLFGIKKMNKRFKEKELLKFVFTFCTAKK